jgi:predicted O-linked N-acetylglucosamine transferase (SPINDLY family)
MQHYKRALEIRDDPVVHFYFAVFLQYMGNLEESKRHYKKVLDYNPTFVEGNSNMIAILLAQGQHIEAYTYLRKVMSFDQDTLGIKDCLLMHYLYDADIETQEIAAAHREWGERVSAKIVPRKLEWANDRDAKRPLRVGFVSGDFRKHAVMHFLRDVFEVLNSREIELYFYSNNKRSDEITERLQQIAAGWQNIIGLNDDTVVELIQEDSIDILVDLAGHTTDNRLLVFARKPAPIQVTWLGYPYTTGLATMDYRLTDSIADPTDSTDWYSEELFRLPEGFLSFSEIVGVPEPSGPPCMNNGVITFGCFNNNAKITPPVISLWAEILNKVPNSHMFLKNDALRSPSVKEFWKKKFEKHDVSLDRIELLPRVDHYTDHVSLYRKVDIALDVFPYNGTTTTCEAMWMGVPVVTLRGNSHVGRVGASLLTRVGLEELIAERPEEYVEKAVALAGNKERIAVFSHDLRDRMRRSALGDANWFARTLEQAFREMWLRWLKKTDGGRDS